MRRILRYCMLTALLLAAGCPKQGGNDADVADVPVRPLDSPLAEIGWDGKPHELALADLCAKLQEQGATALLEQADFSGFSARTEEEDGPEGRTAILIHELPEAADGQQTPVGFQAQLIAFGEGQRMIFGFSAAWYEANFGIGREELDSQFMALHAQHQGVLKNYAFADPDYDICFYQFNFDNAVEGTWGSPYMTRKRFTMHGDLPEWDFYCIGINAGATLATRRSFEQEAGAPDTVAAEAAAFPGEIDASLEPDALLLAADSGIPGLLAFLGIPADSGTPKENFSLERILKPRTRVTRYAIANPEADEASLELLVNDNSTLQRLAFTDAWLAQQGIDEESFNARFEELRDSHKGWSKDINPGGQSETPPLKDSGVQLGSWEISRRLIQLAEGIEARSWALVPIPPQA